MILPNSDVSTNGNNIQAKHVNPLGLTETARHKLQVLSGTPPILCWLPTDSKEAWRDSSDLERLAQRRRPPMFIATTWHAPDPNNVEAILHLADGVWIDIDIKDDHQTIADAVKALGDTVGMMQALGIPLECCSLFASGGKGFHIFIPLALMVPGGAIECGILTARNWPRLCKAFVMDSLLTELTDCGIYSGGRGRLFRQPSVQRNNGAYKVPLGWNEWQGLTNESYREVCSKPRDAIFTAPVGALAIGAAMAWNKALKSLLNPRKAPAALRRAVKLGSGGSLLTTDKQKIESALRQLDGKLDYGDWLRVGMALKSTGAKDAQAMWVNHSRHHPKYRPGECEAKWEGFNGSVGLGTLFMLAKNGGRV